MPTNFVSTVYWNGQSSLNFIGMLIKPQAEFYDIAQLANCAGHICCILCVW